MMSLSILCLQVGFLIAYIFFYKWMLEMENKIDTLTNTVQMYIKLFGHYEKD